MKNSAKWELRVGLLLGLAFIIAFGMILSELRDPVTSPAAEEKPMVDTSYNQTSHPSLARENPGETKLSGDPIPVDLSRERQTASRGPRVDMTQTHMQRATISRGQEVAPTPQRPAPRVTPPAAPVVQRAGKKYRVVDGDTLFRIAQKKYGRANGPKWRKIYEANRNKLSSPSAIRPGQVLLIPSLEGSAPATSQDRALQDIRDHVSRRASATTTATTPRNRTTSRAKIHVVKSNDNLTKIARQYLGDTSSASIEKIFKANSDQLDDPNDVPIGMKLRIPAN